MVVVIGVVTGLLGLIIIGISGDLRSKEERAFGASLIVAGVAIAIYSQRIQDHFWPPAPVARVRHGDGRHHSFYSPRQVP